MLYLPLSSDNSETGKLTQSTHLWIDRFRKRESFFRKLENYHQSPKNYKIAAGRQPFASNEDERTFLKMGAFQVEVFDCELIFELGQKDGCCSTQIP